MGGSVRRQPSPDVFSTLHGSEGSGAVSSLYRTATSPAASMAAYSSQEQQPLRAGPSASLPAPELQLSRGPSLLSTPIQLGRSSSSSSRALVGAPSGDAALDSDAFASPFMADAAESRVLVDESTRLWVASRSPPRAAPRVEPARGRAARQALDFHEGAFGPEDQGRGRKIYSVEFDVKRRGRAREASGVCYTSPQACSRIRRSPSFDGPGVARRTSELLTAPSGCFRRLGTASACLSAL